MERRRGDDSDVCRGEMSEAWKPEGVVLTRVHVDKNENGDQKNCRKFCMQKSVISARGERFIKGPNSSVDEEVDEKVMA